MPPIFSCAVVSALRTASLNAAATRSSSMSLSSLSRDGSIDTRRTSFLQVIVTFTRPAPDWPSTSIFASSSCIFFMFSCICWACFISPASWPFIMDVLLLDRMECAERFSVVQAPQVRFGSNGSGSGRYGLLVTLGVGLLGSGYGNESVRGARATALSGRHQRTDRARHDARAELAYQRLHERIRADLALGVLLTLRARRGIERGCRAARRTDLDHDLDRTAESFSQRGLQLGDLRRVRVLRDRHVEPERRAVKRHQLAVECELI